MYVDCINGKSIIFENVLFTPHLKTDILSLGKLHDQGFNTTCKMDFLPFMIAKEDFTPNCIRQRDYI